MSSYSISAKELFLMRIKSGSTRKFKYNGYRDKPIRYAGGKGMACGVILEYIPDDITKLVSPFLGGGSIEIACANELGIEVKGYDIFDLLVNYWQIQLSSPEMLGARLRQLNSSKTTYNKIKIVLTDHWEKKNTILNQLDLAAYYWYNMQLSWGPIFLGWYTERHGNINSYKNYISKLETFKCPLLTVKQGLFQKTIPKHKNDFLYCDPPYYHIGTTICKPFYPNCMNPIHHENFDHNTLRELLHEHNDRFVLSYNDCETIRKMYSDFRIEKIEWQYKMKHKKSSEILIIKD